MLVSDIAGVKPYFKTPDGLTGARGSLVPDNGCGTEAGMVWGAAACGADGVGLVEIVVDAGTGVDLEENMKAVIDAPAAAEPAAIRASVDFDIAKERTIEAGNEGKAAAEMKVESI